VEVRHAKVIDPADVRRRGLNIRMEIHPGSALRDDAHLDAGLAERRGGNVARRHVLRRRTRAADERPSCHGALPFPTSLHSAVAVVCPAFVAGCAGPECTRRTQCLPLRDRSFAPAVRGTPPRASGSLKPNLVAITTWSRTAASAS